MATIVPVIAGSDTPGMITSTSTLLFEANGFEFHVLTPQYRDETLILLSRAFFDSEPVCTAAGKRDARWKTPLHEWVEFVEFWMDHCSSNRLSVIAIDPKKHRVAGAFIVRDLMMVPEGFDQLYATGSSRSLAPWMQFLWQMDEKAMEKMPPLAEAAKNGNAVDLWFLGVHPDYRGNKIANFLMKGVLPLIRKAGFKYGTIEATSHFTSCAARWNDFTPVHTQHCSEFLYEKEAIYKDAEGPHGEWCFWVKDLQEEKDKVTGA